MIIDIYINRDDAIGFYGELGVTHRVRGNCACVVTWTTWWSSFMYDEIDRLERRGENDV